MLIHNAESGQDCAFLTNQSVAPMYDLVKRKQTIVFKKPPYITGRASVVGKKESNGPIGNYFKDVLEKEEKTFEKTELRMLNKAVTNAIKDANLKLDDIDVLLAGDLLNQITSSSYVARELKIPYMGLYSACSTMTECMTVGACFLDSGYFNTVACATASHFATAERQYRYPLEYGCQRPPYAQWTVTGAGCSVLSSQKPMTDKVQNPVKITMSVVGKVVDFGINDINNMGAAMAPAAMDTMLALFKENNLSQKDFDLIITGDLGKLGSDILRDLMREQGFELGKRYVDCGNLIYGRSQDCYQGGSGAGCSAAVVNSFILEKMDKGEYDKIAYLATGALMNPTTCFQGETIPCISHCVVIEK